MIGIIDYGMGNLRSVQKALEAVGAEARIAQRPEDLAAADKIVLPGVGAMLPAMQRLTDLGLTAPIKAAVAAGKPFLGICLGFQLLFETSTEGGTVPGLGILPGTVERFSSLKVPHMGWNQIRVKPQCPLWRGIADGTYVYFCHSYFVRPTERDLTAAWTDYGRPFTAAVWQGNLYGVQFHPEKSQDIGLTILRNFHEAI